MKNNKKNKKSKYRTKDDIEHKVTIIDSKLNVKVDKVSIDDPIWE